MTEILDVRQAPALAAGAPPSTSDNPAAGARHAADAALTAGSDRYLTFSLGGEVFALPILAITEILEFRGLTVVPMMPTFIRGVLNLRGRVVPVIDLAARFERGTTDIARRTSIVIVEATTGDDADDADGQDMGIIVDAVNKVVHLSPDDIEPPPAFGAGVRADFIAGMARYDGEFIIVLDAARVLCLDEMAQLSRTTAAGRHPQQQNPDPSSAGPRATAEGSAADPMTTGPTADPTTAEAASA